MPERHLETPPPKDSHVRRRAKAGFGYAVRQKLKEGYGCRDFRADLMSGTVVGLVAIPLGMALAIASGVAPQHGIYTVILAGILVALLGGSRFQVTGPTAAFVVILAPIASEHGLAGLLTAGFLAGIILLLFGLGRLGRLIEFIPYPVTTGFTSGIAVVIATLQLKDFLGLTIPHMPETYPEKVAAIAEAIPSIAGPEVSIGLFTLALLIVWPKLNRRIPAPFIALSLASIAAFLINTWYPEVSFATIGSRFSYEFNGITGQGIPPMLPRLMPPWLVGSGDSALTLKYLSDLLPSAFAIALLGAIESLLSAVVADGMAKTRHEPDAELMALGVGNVVCAFFGGIPATGAIARTATNIRFGARSPFSSVIHGVFTLAVILLFAPYVSYLPMASLSALLLLVAYNMSEIRHFAHIVRIGPRSDVATLLTCFLLTVVFDMVIGVSVGVLLAALLFMKKMASSVRLSAGKPHPRHGAMPKDSLLYEISGPLFFGAAERAVEALDGIQSDIKTVLFLMEDVPVMDVTGLVALESAILNLTRQGLLVYLIGVGPQPRRLMLKSEALARGGNIFFCSTVDGALKHRSRLKGQA